MTSTMDSRVFGIACVWVSVWIVIMDGDGMHHLSRIVPLVDLLKLVSPPPTHSFCSFARHRPSYAIQPIVINEAHP